jgi:hypothetical protein
MDGWMKVPNESDAFPIFFIFIRASLPIHFSFLSPTCVLNSSLLFSPPIYDDEVKKHL